MVALVQVQLNDFIFSIRNFDMYIVIQAFVHSELWQLTIDFYRFSLANRSSRDGMICKSSTGPLSYPIISYLLPSDHILTYPILYY